MKQAITSFLKCSWRKVKNGKLWSCSGSIFTYQVRLAQWRDGWIHLCPGFFGKQESHTSTIHRNAIAQAILDKGIEVVDDETGDYLCAAEVGEKMGWRRP